MSFCYHNYNVNIPIKKTFMQKYRERSDKNLKLARCNFILPGSMNMYVTEEQKAYSGSILCVLYCYVNFQMNAVHATEISIKVYKNILKQK